MTQLKLYSRKSMTKIMHRDREDYESKKAGDILQTKKFQVRALAKKGYSVGLIASLLNISSRTVTVYLIEK